MIIVETQREEMGRARHLIVIKNTSQNNKEGKPDVCSVHVFARLCTGVQTVTQPVLCFDISLRVKTEAKRGFVQGFL